MAVVIVAPDVDNVIATWVHVCVANPVALSATVLVPDVGVRTCKKTPVLVKIWKRATEMPFVFVIVSANSRTLACLPVATAVAWAVYIQKVIAKLVELKYVSVGSVRKLMYAAALAVTVLAPLM
jgi:hypothetical protein